MTIRARLLLLVLVAALPVVLLDLWSEFDHRRRDDADIADQAVRLAELTAAEQDGEVEVARTLLATLAASDPVRSQDGAACSDLFRRTLDELPAYTGLAAARDDGEIFCSTDPASVGNKLGDRDYFQGSLNGRDFVVGAFRMGYVSGRKILPMADYAETPAGPVVLVVSLDLDRFSAGMTVPPLPEDSEVLVLDRAGTVLARRPDPEGWIGRVAAAGSILPRAVALGRGVMEGPGLDGTERVFGVAPLERLGDLVVAVGLPRDRIYAEADALFAAKLGTLVLVFGAAAIAAVAGGQRSIVAPLEALEAAVGRIARGDLATRSAVRSSVPEFARLGRQFDRMAESLERHEAELRQALDAREMLVREASHRVKNSLQMIASLLRLQAQVAGSPEVAQNLKEAAGRVIAVAQAHERLYRGVRVGVVDFGPYLQALCDDLARSFGASNLRCDADDVEMSADRAIPVALIVNELVTNAFKYAYPAEASGSVEVGFVAEPDGAHRLEVADHGVGLPDGFQPERSPTLGMRIVTALVHQLGGTLEARRGDPGTRFTIRLPPVAIPQAPQLGGLTGGPAGS